MREPSVEDGLAVADPERDLAKIAVVERHLATGRVGLGFVAGSGLQRGALASSVAHDAHNLVVVGMSDDDWPSRSSGSSRSAAASSPWSDGSVLAECPLPIAGLLSDAPLADVIDQSRACNEAAHELGWTGASPFLTLSFLGLSVIPQLKITDRGLVDVDRFELVPLAAVTTLYAGGWIVTCDDAGTEHDAGWLLVEDGLVSAVGAGDEPEADERVDLGGAVVTPGLVNTHHHLYQTLTRARAQQADLFSWLRELYPVWAGIDAESEYAAARDRPRRARTLRLHDGLRPPLRLPARTRRADRGRGAGGTRARRADRRLARLDGPRRVRRRAAARRARGGHRRGARGHGAPRRRAPRARPRRTRADRGRAVLAVLGDEAAHVGVRGARPPSRPDAAHPSRRDRRGGGVLPAALRLHARRVSDRPRLARQRRVVRALRPPLRGRHRRLRRARRQGVAHCPTSNLRLGAGVAPVRDYLAEGIRVGLGVDGSASNERSDLLLEVEAGAARRARPRRARSDDRAGGARAGYARRSGDARPRRHRLARARQVRGLRRLADGRPRARRRRGPRRGARLLRSPSRRPARRRRRGRRARRGARRTPTRARSRASSERRREDSPT